MRLRSVLGYSLFSVGGMLVAFAIGNYAVGALKQEDARRAWDEAEAKAVVALARRSMTSDGLRPAPVMPGVPVARLIIPRLQMDEIVMEGVDGNELNAGPGHLTGSAYPGEPGNSVISAHRDRHFARLGEISVGDTLLTESGAHQNRWVVIAKRVIDADTPALFHTSTATLTLTTCWPIRYVGPAPERLLVTAKPIEPRQTPTFASAGTT